MELGWLRMKKENVIAWKISLTCLVSYIPLYIKICTESSVLIFRYCFTVFLSFAGRERGDKKKRRHE